MSPPIERFRRTLVVAASGLLGVTAFSWMPVAAQEAGIPMHGRVIDAESGSPVVGALVEFLIREGAPTLGAQFRAVTGESGDFEVRVLAEQQGLLEVRHLAYGVHHHRLDPQDDWDTGIEVAVSEFAITLAPVVVDAQASRDLRDRANPASRNVLGREDIEARLRGMGGNQLGDFIARSFPGLTSGPNARSPGDVCVEFRMARSDGYCRPPLVYLDGIRLQSPGDIFASFPIGDLEQIQVMSPAEAGVAFGGDSGWGVVVLTTRRGGLAQANPGVPIRADGGILPRGFDWSAEEETAYPWGTVYASAFAGNAVGLAASAFLISRCIDLGTKTFYRSAEDRCGGTEMVGIGILASVLPALAGAATARFAGATDRSVGSLRYSVLVSQAVFIPGYAALALSDGTPVGEDGGISGFELGGMILVAGVGPLLNTLADRYLRGRR